ncbi:MAG TPA: hypothetical protein VN428_23255 [Bryobacteraceae bacterium]|nr:hypothetical protein [Bryobacteraceae bacterium]
MPAEGAGHGGVDVGIDEAFQFGVNGAFDVVVAAGALKLPKSAEGFIECAVRSSFVTGEGGEALCGAFEGVGEIGFELQRGVGRVDRRSHVPVGIEIGFVRSHMFGEEIGFDHGDAVELPLGLGELSDEEYFGGAGWFVLSEERI